MVVLAIWVDASIPKRDTRVESDVCNPNQSTKASCYCYFHLTWNQLAIRPLPPSVCKHNILENEQKTSLPLPLFLSLSLSFQGSTDAENLERKEILQKLLTQNYEEKKRARAVGVPVDSIPPSSCTSDITGE